MEALHLLSRSKHLGHWKRKIIITGLPIVKPKKENGGVCHLHKDFVKKLSLEFNTQSVCRITNRENSGFPPPRTRTTNSFVWEIKVRSLSVKIPTYCTITLNFNLICTSYIYLDHTHKSPCTFITLNVYQMNVPVRVYNVSPCTCKEHHTISSSSQACVRPLLGKAHGMQ